MKSQVIILAAGKSERMGMPKPFIVCYGKTFLEHITQLYERIPGRIIIVFSPENYSLFKSLNEFKNSNFDIVINDKTGSDRFYSVKLGAAKALQYNIPTFLHNIDNPFVSEQTIELLLDHSSDADVIVPAYKGKGGHPILLSPSVLRKLTESPHESFDLRKFLFNFTKKHIETTDLEILRNINTKKDLPCATFSVKN